MTNKYIDILNDNELTIKNAKKVYFAIHRYYDAINVNILLKTKS